VGYTFIESDLGEVLADFDLYDTFAIDIETTGVNPYDSRILLCQIGFNDKEYVIDAAKVDISPIATYLKSNKWQKLLFNAKFEGSFFLHFYGTQINNIFDCYLAERIINPDNKFGNSFEDLALKYLDVKLDKTVRKSFFGKKPGKFTEKQIKYAAEDVRYLFPLMSMQETALKEKEMEQVAELEFAIATVVAEMELTGVTIDKDKWRGLLQVKEKELEESRQRMYKILYDDHDVLDEQLGMFERSGINLGSPKQLNEALNKIGLDIESTKEEVIALIDHPAARELMVYRKLDKIMNAYGYSMFDKIHPFTGRIHADFRQLGTETGRFSCKEPNLQQMPEEFRECFIAGEGYVFVGADYSQIELRVLAELSGDPVLVASFQAGHDLHTATAANMFNVPQTDVTKEQRFAAKTLNFGLVYGMGVDKLKNSLNGEAQKTGSPTLNIRQVQAIHYKYKNTIKTAITWLENTGNRAVRDGVAETIYGRKRFFNRPTSSLNRKEYDRQLAGIRRQGANTPIQGTSADITKLALLNLHNELREYNFKGNVVLQVHDEIVVLAHKSQAEAIKDIVVESMVSAGQQLLRKVPVKVDSYISDIWKK
jgi:DNA polymerase I-like protein with 3'-5' exonuclease and polymerase domains